MALERRMSMQKRTLGAERQETASVKCKAGWSCRKKQCIRQGVGMKRRMEAQVEKSCSGQEAGLKGRAKRREHVRKLRNEGKPSDEEFDRKESGRWMPFSLWADEKETGHSVLELKRCTFCLGHEKIEIWDSSRMILMDGEGPLIKTMKSQAGPFLSSRETATASLNPSSRRLWRGSDRRLNRIELSTSEENEVGLQFRTRKCSSLAYIHMTTESKKPGRDIFRRQPLQVCVQDSLDLLYSLPSLLPICRDEEVEDTHKATNAKLQQVLVGSSFKLSCTGKGSYRISFLEWNADHGACEGVMATAEGVKLHGKHRRAGDRHLHKRDFSGASCFLARRMDEANKEFHEGDRLKVQTGTYVLRRDAKEVSVAKQPLFQREFREPAVPIEEVKGAEEDVVDEDEEEEADLQEEDGADKGEKEDEESREGEDDDEEDDKGADGEEDERDNEKDDEEDDNKEEEEDGDDDEEEEENEQEEEKQSKEKQEVKELVHMNKLKKGLIKGVFEKDEERDRQIKEEPEGRKKRKIADDALVTKTVLSTVEHLSNEASPRKARLTGTTSHRDDCGCVVCEGRRRREQRIRRYGRDITKKELDRMRKLKKRGHSAKVGEGNVRADGSGGWKREGSGVGSEEEEAKESPKKIAAPPLRGVLRELQDLMPQGGQTDSAESPASQQNAEAERLPSRDLRFGSRNEKAVLDPDPVLPFRTLNPSILQVGAILFSNSPGALLWKNRNRPSIGEPFWLSSASGVNTAQETVENTCTERQANGSSEAATTRGRGSEDDMGRSGLRAGPTTAEDVESAVKELLAFREEVQRGREGYTFR